MKGRKLNFREKVLKLTEDKNERRKVFNELLKHVEAGYSLSAFHLISETTIRKYLKTYPEEFCEDELEAAFRKGRTYWEGIGRRQANGECLGNSRTWFYNMANRYGWRDKLEVEAEHSGQIQVNVVSYATAKSSKDNSKKE